MVDQSLCRPLGGDGAKERLRHQARGHPLGHGVADQFAVEQVLDTGKIESALVGGDVGDIADPGPTPEIFALAIVRMDMASDGAGLTGVRRQHLDEVPAAPVELVAELRGKQAPALVENAPVQSGFCWTFIPSAFASPAADADKALTLRSSRQKTA